MGSIVFAVVLPEPFTLADKIAMVGLGCLMAAVLHLLGRCRVVADDEGVTVVNPVRTHRYSWPEVLDVTLIEGEPWAKIDFSDGATVGAMGIMGSEKALARRQAAELDALIRLRAEARGPADPPA
ncbi:PH domain-containing protein [Thermocatellispora tengchongensis]|uniref:PH domain-containing protein n=1 Tax=Thermocatellispora tengchongensis TaxID=1073253 RepID=UPI00363E4544